MSFTGKLGTSDSLLGNIILAFNSQQQMASGQIDVVVSDSGTGLDTVSLTATVGTVTEQSSSLDVVGIGLSSADSGSSSDAFSLIVSAADTGTGSDSVSVAMSGATCDATSGTLTAPLQRLGPEYFYPHWTTANSDRTGLLFAICQWAAETEFQYKSQAARAFSGRFLAATRTLEPLYEWTLNFVPSSDSEFTIAYQATTASGTVSRTARRAVSQFDYDTTVDPVWYQDTNARVIRLRNLFMRTIQRYTSGTVYTICGADAAGSFGVVPDTGYFYRRHPLNNWEWLSPESERFGSSTVQLPASGTWLIAYGSVADLASILASGTATITYHGGITRSLRLQLQQVSNLFDGYGFLLGIPRILRPLESNTGYKARMVAAALSPPDATLGGVLRGIASRFGLLKRVVWDGVSTKQLDPFSDQRITSLQVVGVDRLFEVSETLYPTSGNIKFYSTFSNWREGSLVLVNGVPVNTYALSGNRLTFTQPVTGQVSVVYSAQTYDTVTNVDGYISAVRPGQGIPSGSYDVLYTSAVAAHSIDQPDYQQASLLDARGLPNSLFNEVANRLTENNPTTFGRARWGPNSTWFDQSEDKPETSRLVIPFDVNTSNG